MLSFSQGLEEFPLSFYFASFTLLVWIASLTPSLRSWYAHTAGISRLPPQWHSIPRLRMAGWIEASLSASGVEWMTIHNLIKKPTLTKYGIARMTVVQFGAVLRFREIVYLSSPEYIEWFLATERKHPKRQSQATLDSDTFGCHVFNSSGSAWTAHRRVMNPALGSAPNRRIIASETRDLVALTSTSETWDAGILLQRFAVNVLGNTLFGINFDAMKTPKIWFEPMKRIEHILEPRFSDWLTPLQRFDDFAKSPANMQFREDQLQRMVAEVMIRKEDFADEPLKYTLVDVLAKDQLQPMPVLNTARIKENLEFLFFSGHHSITLALCHIVRQLSLQPSLYERVVEEADRTVMVPEHSESLIRNLVLEALRFHPPIEESPDYVASEDLWLPGGYFVPRGGILRFSALAAHHTSTSYDSPSLFNPDRNMHNLDAKYWLPFGLGQRRCPARHLAINILAHATLALVQNFRFELQGRKHLKRMHFKSFMGTEPDRLMIRFIPRSPTVPGDHTSK